MDAACSAQEAVTRGWALYYDRTGKYILGTGSYGDDWKNPYTIGEDKPGHLSAGCDCAGFAICWAWKLARHRPGFNDGEWSTCSDDLNVNSAIEDGQHKQELFETLGSRFIMPKRGDLLCYPTIYLRGKEFVGHVGLVVNVPVNYQPNEGWHRLEILQCHGPNGFTPTVVSSDGSIWDQHDHVWPLPEHRTQLVRPKERTA